MTPALRLSAPLLSAGLLIAGCAMDAGAPPPAPPPPGRAAVAMLADAAGAAKGTATVTETAAGLTLSVEATGLPPGPHGLHVHMVGVCEGPGFTSAGAHWNPTAKMHGHDNPQGAHWGDFPNVEADAGGAGRAAGSLAGARLSDGPNPLIDADGAAVAIHAGPDDYRTDPTGNSGGRIACGVLRLR